MGADFMINICNAYDGTKEEMKQRIADYCSNLTLDDWTDWDMFIEIKAEEGDLAEFKAEMLDYLTTCVNEIYFSYRRDVGEVRLDGKSYMMTGGMSWGDAPTEAYNMVGAIAWSGLDVEVGDG